MSIDAVHVIAEVRLLATAEGGKTVPICGSYRPNHNFFGDGDAEMTVGSIEIPDGVVLAVRAGHMDSLRVAAESFYLHNR